MIFKSTSFGQSEQVQEETWGYLRLAENWNKKLFQFRAEFTDP